MDSRGFHLYLKKLHYYHSGSASALQKHSLLCIIITQERQLAVIFEDDAEVSPQWYGTEIGNLQKKKHLFTNARYRWLVNMWTVYGGRKDLAAISLQRQTMRVD